MSKSDNAHLPKAWPPGLNYLTTPVYCKSLSLEVLSELHKWPGKAHQIQLSQAVAGPSRHVRITAILDAKHPACGQYGLFTRQHLPPNSFILFYLGLVHGSDDSDPHSDYDLSFDRELGIGIDAAKMGNEARFINDYRGIQAGPNAEFRDIWIHVGGRLEKRTAVFVLSAGESGKRAKGIAKGEEILVSYGKGFWSERRKGEEEASVQHNTSAIVAGDVLVRD